MDLMIVALLFVAIVFLALNTFEIVKVRRAIVDAADRMSEACRKNS